MSRKKTDIESALVRKGFRLIDTHHHRFIYFSEAGKKTSIYTKTSHTPKMKEIPDSLVGQMAQQCKLTKSQFGELLDCPMDRKKYETFLKEKNLI